MSSKKNTKTLTKIKARVITGTERLGWDQRAADAVELGTFRYAIYVDGVRSELTDVSCETSSSGGAYPCSVRLPPLTAGTHVLELASFIVSGSVLESARSAPIQLTVTSTTLMPDAATFRAGPVITSLDNVLLRADLVADGFDAPADLAFAPDGRLFVAEKRGRVRVIPPRRADGFGPGAKPDVARHTAGVDANSTYSDVIASVAVLALAFDPKFDRTHFLFVLHTLQADDGSMSFAITRFREARDTLADAVVLLDHVPAARDHAAGRLRFGPDGKLYAAFDDAGDPAAAADLAAWNGKMLRLNADGTTPDDQAGLSPVFSFAYRAPVGIGWDAAHRLWVADAADANDARLSIVAASGSARTRAVTLGTVALPRATVPSDIAFYHGDLLPSFADNLLIASAAGRHLLRARIDPNDDTHILDSEALLQDRVGPVYAVAIGPDGAIYFATAGAVGRLAPGAPATHR